MVPFKEEAGRDPSVSLSPTGQAAAISAGGGTNTDPLLKAVHCGQVEAVLRSQGAGNL